MEHRSTRWMGLALAWAACAAGVAHAEKRVAVVVGVSDYDSLPDELQPSSARDDARRLARYLEDTAGYEVQILLDKVVTKDVVERMLLESLPGTMTAGDTLLFAFVGHGVGADFGEPYLLFNDSRVDALDETALGVLDLGPKLARAYSGVNVVVITDAAHDGSFEGVALMGPHAKSWPAMPGYVALLSASGPDEVAPDGMFLPLLVSGLEGSADSNEDGKVTVSELHRNLLVEVAAATSDTVHPTEAGTYDPSLVIGTVKPTLAVDPTPVATTSVVAAPPPVADGGGWGGPVSYGMLGAAALAGGFTGVAYVRGRAACETPQSGEGCLDTATYSRWRRAYIIGLASTGVLAVGGVGLGFVPLDGGAWVGTRVAF